MFSLILDGFDGKAHDLYESFRVTFGLYGCAPTFAWDRARKHLPAELAADLTPDDAAAHAKALRTAGASVRVVPTAEVADVRHRAAEIWPTHRASNGEVFYAFDGIVTTLPSLNARDNLALMRQRSPDAPLFGLELSLNHQHPTHDFDRNALRIARRDGGDCAAALRECFPDREFALVYREEQYSFCQWDDAVTEGFAPGDRRTPPRCPACAARTDVVARTEPDAEFPCAQFGDCTVCGGEVLLWADDETLHIRGVKETLSIRP